jgi:putative ABC transport system permease protein
MRPLRAWLLRLGGLFQKRRRDRELADELESHLAMHIEDNVRAGMTAEEARRAALLKLGGVEQTKEAYRDQRGFPFVEGLRQDVRFAFRNFRRNPGFTISVIASLALGIGAVVAIFTAADDLLFRPLPYRDAAKLVMLWESNRDRPETTRSVVSPDNFLDWKARNSVFEDMAVADEGRSVFSDGNRSEELLQQAVSGNFFSLLGVHALQGRTYIEDDAMRSSGDALVISYRLWQSWFGGDPAVIGRRVLLDSQPRTILGVMPAGFAFGNQDVDLWPSMTLLPSAPHDRGPRNMKVLARLKPEVGISRAQSQMEAIAKQLEQEDPQFDKNWTVVLEPVRESFVRSVKSSLLLLLGAVSLLLIVACANAANLLLAQYASRQTEIAVRCAIGAGPSQLLRQLLTESLVLACCAGVLGLAVGRGALSAIVALAPQTLTQAAQITIDWRIVLFAIGLAVLVGFLFGLAPSVMASKGDLLSGLKRESQRRSVRWSNPRAWLIAGEIAASVILLVGATLLFQSLVKLQSVDPGLNPRNVLTFHFRVMSPHDIHRFREAISGIQRVPGVRSVSAISFLPFAADAASTSVEIEGRPPAKPGEELAATVRTVMPGYFETIGIPILQGRDFAEADNTPQSPMHFVVNEAFARKYLGDERPIGKTISVQMARSNPFADVIGVVGNVKEGSLSKAAVPTVYYVYEHMPYGQMTLVVRGEQDAEALVGPVRSVIHEIDPGLAIANLRTMESILGETYARERFTVQLLAVFSISALLLAAIGIYGVLAYSVSERTKEIGVRVAVGASPERIVTMVLGDVAWVVMAGLTAGVVGSFLLSRLVSSLLFETSAVNPLAFGFALCVLVVAAFAAAYFPVRRAIRVDPMIALRYE